jgi:hypothetical protein
MRLFEEFWWASAMSRMDIRDAQDDVWTRGVHRLSRAVPPEEVTTFNLVRRVAGRRRAAGGLSIALHSRPLEGGNTTTGRLPSGADLELAVEVAPGAWADFALQAKKFNPLTGKYEGWDPTQNAHLVKWARASGRRAAGMLLYNSTDPPFAPPGHASPVFNLCCSDTWCHGWKWPRWEWPDGRSPLAVSLILDIADPRVSQLANPTPKDVADLALPWECLFCPTAQKMRLGGVIGGQPEWVGLIPEPPGDTNEEASRNVSTQIASYSLVLGMSDEERTDARRVQDDGASPV